MGELKHREGQQASRNPGVCHPCVRKGVCSLNGMIRESWLTRRHLSRDLKEGREPCGWRAGRSVPRERHSWEYSGLCLRNNACCWNEWNRRAEQSLGVWSRGHFVQDYPVLSRVLSSAAPTYWPQCRGESYADALPLSAPGRPSCCGAATFANKFGTLWTADLRALLFFPFLHFPVLEWWGGVAQRTMDSSPNEGIMPANPAVHPQGADMLCFKTWIVVKDKYTKAAYIWFLPER